MLGWLTGAQRLEAADDSKFLDAPETPAPVFAIRAFKTALFGTPGVEDSEHPDAPTVGRSQSNRKRAALEHAGERNAKPLEYVKDPFVYEKRQPMASPTKSILMTPGTNVRRKTVSFGEGVVENERATTRKSHATSGLPQNYPGKFPSPWSVKRSDSRSGGKSKLTQSLLNARDGEGTGKVAEEQLPEIVENNEPSMPSRLPKPNLENVSMKDTDETVDMDDPRSKSGRYWKSEYNQYQSKSDREVKKLLQYRHIAKSFAKKNHDEAMRLTEKLKQEEAKVARMEKEVTSMAAKMVGEKHEGDGEDLVKKLAKQTALTLQYKQKVDKLREEMEIHNVLGGGSQEGDKSEVSTWLQETKKELEAANAKISQLTDENGQMRKLQVLAKATGSKASALARENELLKTSLARVKDEMSKYDDRRKAKEEKFKQRESKLEARNQEYRARIEKMTQERQESEKMLQERSRDEKAQLLAQIGELQSSQQGINRGYSPAPQIPLKSPRRRNGDSQTLQPSSAKRNRSGELLIDIWAPDGGDTDLPMEDVSNGQTHLWQSAAAEPTSSLNMVYDHRPAHVPPSSPPILPSVEPSFLAVNSSAAVMRRVTYSPRPRMVNFSSPAKFSTYQPRPSNTTRRTDHASTSSIAQINRVASGGEPRKILPADRKAAAKARLEQRKEQKKLREQGKENLASAIDLEF